MTVEKGTKLIVITEARVQDLIAEAVKAFVTEAQIKTIIAEGFEGTVASISETIKVIPNEDRMQELIAEAIKELVTVGGAKILVDGCFDDTVKLLAEAIKVIPNETQILELIAEFKPLPLALATTATAEETPQLDPDWLEGLTFCGSKLPEQVEGQPRPAFVPFERPLTAEDVLSFTVGEAAVTLITADGNKHTVEI